MSASPRPIRLLESLNLFGLTHLDPVVLAALADERPLLLIAPHGTAKSELLNRLAASLGLEHRHYNASLIAFDDLLGFPVPNPERTGLDYLPTPGNLWGASSVFLDEISRCRPESQNKLFSVIHEKRIQGLALTSLRYRWAAMNPPMTGEEVEEEEVYEGSLPLDPALADRFAYLVALPSFEDMSSKVRMRIIREGGEAPSARPKLERVITRARQAAVALRQQKLDWTVRYVDALVMPLREAGLPISGRRAVSLAQSIVSIAGAAEALRLDLGLEGSAFLALKWGLPHRGQGRRIEEGKLRSIHRLALQQAGSGEDGIWPQLRGLKDPVHRVAAAFPHYPKGISKLELSNLVSEAFGALSVPRRHLLALTLAPSVMEKGCLNLPTMGLLTGVLERLRVFSEANQHTLTASIAQVRGLNQKIARIGQIGASEPALGNLMLHLLAVEKEDFDPDTLLALAQDWRSRFAEGGAEEVA